VNRSLVTSTPCFYVAPSNAKMDHGPRLTFLTPRLNSVSCNIPATQHCLLHMHRRSHTKEKPFECQTCMRCFARKDLMLRHKRKLHVISRKPPRQGGDSPESTAVYPVSCDRICGRSIHHSVNSALPEKLTRDVALNADIVHHSDSSNFGLTEVADSHLSFCTVEGLENPARYSHIDGTSSAWSLVCSDGSQTLTATGRWKSFPGLYEDDEHTVYHSTISNSLAIPQAVGEVTSPNIGKLFDYGTEANTAKLYLDGNARARENASTLQSWTPEIMQPGFDKHNDCRWRTEWKSRQSYEHGSIAYGDAIVESQGCTRWCELLVNLGPRGSIRGQSFATTSSILKQDGMQPSQHSPGNDPAL
jgi:hypothetical protein